MLINIIILIKKKNINFDIRISLLWGYWAKKFIRAPWYWIPAHNIINDTTQSPAKMWMSPTQLHSQPPGMSKCRMVCPYFNASLLRVNKTTPRGPIFQSSSSPLSRFAFFCRERERRKEWRRWWVWDQCIDQYGADLIAWPASTSSFTAITTLLEPSSISHPLLPLPLLATPLLLLVLYNSIRFLSSNFCQ